MIIQKQIFYDVPEKSEWYRQFNVLFIPRSHRMILNRQPQFAWDIQQYDDLMISFFDWKVDWEALYN
jgi:hypothetical protein